MSQDYFPLNENIYWIYNRYDIDNNALSNHECCFIAAITPKNMPNNDAKNIATNAKITVCGIASKRISFTGRLVW